MPKSKAELEHDLEALKIEHDMFKFSLQKGLIIVLGLIIAFAWTISAKISFLDGNQYLVLVGIVVAGILVYYSFVFHRELKLKAKVSEKIKELEVSSGKKVA